MLVCTFWSCFPAFSRSLLFLRVFWKYLLLSLVSLSSMLLDLSYSLSSSGRIDSYTPYFKMDVFFQWNCLDVYCNYEELLQFVQYNNLRCVCLQELILHSHLLKTPWGYNTFTSTINGPPLCARSEVPLHTPLHAVASVQILVRVKQFVPFIQFQVCLLHRTNWLSCFINSQTLSSLVATSVSVTLLRVIWLLSVISELSELWGFYVLSSLY